jgi:tRNA (cmo5U34)-methyltransferase
MTKVGDGLTAMRANWTFSGDTAENFDAHVSKSVPLYAEGHDLVCELSDFFVQPDTMAYEIGCSTGALTIQLARRNAGKPNARFIGIDREPKMIDKAKSLYGAEKGVNLAFELSEAMEFDFEPSDFIVAYYTVQFVHPSQRQLLIDKIYKSLQWGGAFLLFEKVRGPDARFQDIAARAYDEYKLRQGYTPEEIVSKTRSLKGVMEPFSTQGNIDLLRRAGFVDVMTIMKYICFEGFFAIK